MAFFNTSGIEKRISEKNIFIHALAILIVCAVFGILNLIQGSVRTGIMTIACGAVIFVVTNFILKNTKKSTRGVFLTQATTLTIISLATSNGELHAMFPLLVAGMAIGAIYYSIRNIEINWIMVDLFTIGGAFLPDRFYVGTELGIVIKGIIGINIGAFMIRLLMKVSLNSIKEAESAAEEADGLLVQVNNRMNETTEMSEKQADMMAKVASIAETLDVSSQSMSDISERISAASQEQAASIEEVYANAEQIAKEAADSLSEAEKAAAAAEHSAEMLKENNADMQKMVDAMADISDSSHKISSIIKTIEDISFQTNILALNAAVEAARAGAAGKGFAVVADEVRNLANKSAEAAKNTTILINESITAVENGTAHAKTTAEKLESIIEYSNKSERHAREIARLTKNQQSSVEMLRERIASVSNIISENTQTAEESAGIAHSVFEEIEKMNDIVSAG